MELKLALVSLNLGPPSLEICVCTFAYEKVKDEGMLMTKLHVLICLIRCDACASSSGGSCFSWTSLWQKTQILEV